MVRRGDAASSASTARAIAVTRDVAAVEVARRSSGCPVRSSMTTRGSRRGSDGRAGGGPGRRGAWGQGTAGGGRWRTARCRAPSRSARPDDVRRQESVLTRGIRLTLVRCRAAANRPFRERSGGKLMPSSLEPNARLSSSSCSPVRELLGSHGSPGAYVTRADRAGWAGEVTDERWTHCFVASPEAVHLVLQTAAFSVDAPHTARDAATCRDHQSGVPHDLALRPAPRDDADVVFTGIRAGEKLFEELLTDAEQAHPTPHPYVRCLRRARRRRGARGAGGAGGAGGAAVRSRPARPRRCGAQRAGRGERRCGRRGLSAASTLLSGCPGLVSPVRREDRARPGHRPGWGARAAGCRGGRGRG